MTRETLRALAQNLAALGIDEIAIYKGEEFQKELTEKVGDYWKEDLGFARVFAFEGVRFIVGSPEITFEEIAVDDDELMPEKGPAQLHISFPEPVDEPASEPDGIAVEASILTEAPSPEPIATNDIEAPATEEEQPAPPTEPEKSVE